MSDLQAGTFATPVENRSQGFKIQPIGQRPPENLEPIHETSTTEDRQQRINQAKLRSSKLSGTRAHLQSLIQKKLRIEIEIKGLIKTLHKMQRVQRKTLAESFGLDLKDPNLDEKLQALISEDAELASAIQEGDKLIRMIAVNLNDATFDVQQEIDKFI